MEIPKKIIETVKVKSVRVHAKVCDSGIYDLRDELGKTMASREDYVPSFFPGDHYGDYIDLDIDLESGKILNWKMPDPLAVAICFKMIEEES